MSAQTKAAWRAALVNAALFALVPIAWLTYSDYTADFVRPAPRALIAAVAYALRNLAFLFPVSLFVGWRTYALARGYITGATSVWRGPFESAATAGACALIVVLMSTGDGFWTQSPLMLVAALPSYVVATSLYVTGTAIVGLLLGLILASTALTALHLSRADQSTSLLRAD